MIEIFTANKSGSSSYHQPTIKVNLYHQLISNGTSDLLLQQIIREIQVFTTNRLLSVTYPTNRTIKVIF